MILTGYFILVGAALAQNDENGVPLNKTSVAEQQEGWKLLWDGETATGWRGGHSETFPEQGWSIKDGILSVHKTGLLSAKRGGDIITEKIYAAFELSLEFRMTPGANSGIKYYVFPKESGKPTVGLEYQILDDAKHPDADEGSYGNHTLASLYDLIPADNKQVNPPGQWNHARIIAKANGDVEHWLNGVKVVSYNRFSQVFRALVFKSKYENFEDFGRIPAGHILLQDHGHTVGFRNIKLRELPR